MIVKIFICISMLTDYSWIVIEYIHVNCVRSAAAANEEAQSHSQPDARYFTSS